jgi:spore germination cell wall hydrolase CwlJ-like protein
MTAELFIVALTLLGEARGETFEGMAGVASVIQTRMIERNQTASQVCLSPKQFSFWNGGVSEATKKKLLATPQGKNALYLADLVIHKQMPDIVRGANHYHAVSVSPKWAKKGKLVAVIRNHKFYKVSVYCVPLPCNKPYPPTTETQLAHA